MNETMYAVGDRVWIYSIQRGGGDPKPATVMKVGRKLVTVDHGWCGTGETTYRIDGGSRNDQYGHEHIRTEEQKAALDRLAPTLAYLREKRVHDLPRSLSPDALEKIVAIMRAELDEADAGC